MVMVLLYTYTLISLYCTIQENSLSGWVGCRNGKLNLSFFSEKNQIYTDLELFPTQKRILNLKLYKDNNGKEI